MTSVSRFGRDASTVFDLLGPHEPALTGALGWVMAKSPTLLAAVVGRLGLGVPGDSTAVALERVDGDGRTDIEIRTPSAHVIVEAKKGWIVPEELQLAVYRKRFSNDGHRRLVTVSDSTRRWAEQVLPSDIDGVPVEHWSWDDIRALVVAAKVKTGGAERLWLKQLEDYMGGATSTRPATDCLAYCVVISTDIFGGHTFRDYVQHQRVYFHPFASGGWPNVPPNFLAFRWDNAVRQVNRVLDYEVVTRLEERFPSVTEAESGNAHVVYRLGPDIPLPGGALPSGTNLRNRRLWVLVDQLLTQPTVIAAEAESSRLLRQ